MWRFKHLFSHYNLFFSTTIFLCGFKFTLVGGGINSEQTGINNFVFNYSLQDIFATEYEELKEKKNYSQYGPSSHSGKCHESLMSHCSFLRDASVKYGLIICRNVVGRLNE